MRDNLNIIFILVLGRLFYFSMTEIFNPRILRPLGRGGFIININFHLTNFTKKLTKIAVLKNSVQRPNQ
jgi:Na+-transporting methylmalonyl-CoA/oxaloacetate decarboxylase beta subunit